MNTVRYQTTKPQNHDWTLKHSSQVIVSAVVMVYTTGHPRKNAYRNGKRGRQTERQTETRYSATHPKILLIVSYTDRLCSSSLVTLARPSVSSSLQVTNRSFTYASPYLWNQLPSSFRQPHSVHCPPGSPHAHITSSQSPPSLSSPITASTFHSRLKTHLFHKSFPP